MPEPARVDPLATRGDSPIGRIMSTADQATARRQAIDTIRECCDRHTGRMEHGEVMIPANEIRDILERHGV